MQVKYLFIFTAIVAELNFITVDGNCSNENKNFLQQNLDKAVKLRQQQIQYETDDEEDEDDWDDDPWADERDTSTNYSLNRSILSDDIENNNKNIVKQNKDDFKNKMLILEQNMSGRGNVNSKKGQENNNITQVIEKKGPENSNIKQNYIEQQKYNEGSVLKNNIIIDDNILQKISEYKIAKSNYDKNPSNSEVNKLLELANAIITGNASLEVVRSYEMSKRYYNLNMHNGRESRKAIKKLLSFIDDFIDKLIEQKSSKGKIYEDGIKENIIDHLNNIQVSTKENTTKYSVQQQKQLEQLESICDRILQYMKESNGLLSDMIQKRQ